jgi:hypothetical protein
MGAFAVSEEAGNPAGGKSEGFGPGTDAATQGLVEVPWMVQRFPMKGFA